MKKSNSTTAVPEAVALRGHLPELDGLRGMAILLVMFHHFTVITPANALEIWFTNVTGLGMHGVDLFFVLSGFLITGILLDSKGKPNFLRNFYMRRTLRIFPLYYAVLALCFLLLPALLSYSPPAAAKLARMGHATDGWKWYVTYTANFLIARVNNWHHPVLGVTWSLAIEEQFYLFWAVLIMFLSRRALQNVCMAAIVGALLVRVGIWAAGYSWLQIYVLTPCRMDALAWGALIAAYVRSPRYNPEKLLRRAGPILIGVAATLLVAFCLGGLHYDSPVSFTIGYTLVAIIFTQLLVVALHSSKASWTRVVLGSRFLRFFGKYSYAIYLFHLPLRAAIRDSFFGERQFRAWPGFALGWQLLFYVVATLAAVPLALLSWHLLEKRFLKLKSFFSADAEPVTTKAKLAPPLAGHEGVVVT